jgi:tumor protein p53-inducible protein 3
MLVAVTAGAMAWLGVAASFAHVQSAEVLVTVREAGCDPRAGSLQHRRVGAQGDSMAASRFDESEAVQAMLTEVPEEMSAVVGNPGGSPMTVIVPRPVPIAGPGEALVRVMATGTNRAEILQAQGKYPPPAGVTDILGLEAAGIVVALGDAHEHSCLAADSLPVTIGDRVMSLLPGEWMRHWSWCWVHPTYCAGGGHAEFVSVPCRLLMRIPEGVPFEVAAALPEQWLTAYQLLFWVAGLSFNPPERSEPETVVVYAAGSGVGTALVQLLKLTGRRAIAVAGDDSKLESATTLGAVEAVNYKTNPDWSGESLALAHDMG